MTFLLHTSEPEKQIEAMPSQVQVDLGDHHLLSTSLETIAAAQGSRTNYAHCALNPSEKATSAIPLDPTFASVGVLIFPQFSIFFDQPHQIPVQSGVQGVKTANSL